VQKTKATILIVEGDDTMRDLLVDTLGAIGYRVTEASDGIEALQKLKQQSFDLMITDIMAPGMDGVTLLKKAREDYPNLPVLFIAGDATTEVIEGASPDGFLAKPFRISLIEELIENTLRGRGVVIDGSQDVDPSHPT
jgi:CheY-like chemotaxis protein